MTRRVKPAELMIPAPAPVTWNEPQPDWLPWHVARFCYLPHFADPAKHFTRDLTTVVKAHPSFDRSMRFGEGKEAGLCTVWRGNMRLAIDAEDGRFELEAFEQGLVGGGFYGLPEPFFASLDLARVDPENRDDATSLMDLARGIWLAQQAGFAHALRNGMAQVYGRWRSADQPLERVHWDQLRHLEPAVSEVRVWDQSIPDTVAVLEHRGPAPVMLLSPHVRARAVKLRSKGQKAEDAAKAELIEMMRTNPGRRLHPRDVIVRQISNKHSISIESGKRVWREALAACPECNWGRPGAPKKSITSP